MINNLIFDLYGTLIDIHTDEAARSLWKTMAQVYRRCGAFYEPEELRKAYSKLVSEEEASLKKESGYTFPEIRLEKVFHRLLLDAPATVSGQMTEDAAADFSAPSFRKRLADTPEWNYMIANTFRAASLKRFCLYPGTLQTLTSLKKQGIRLFLLSNAQAVFTRPELAMTGLTPLFDAMYISSDQGMKKPQPEFLQLLLKEQRLNPRDCMMVGNETESDLRVAASCGVAGCLLNTGHLEPAAVSERFEALKKEFPSARLAVISSGRIRELTELRVPEASAERSF